MTRDDLKKYQGKRVSVTYLEKSAVVSGVLRHASAEAGGGRWEVDKHLLDVAKISSIEPIVDVD